MCVDNIYLVEFVNISGMKQVGVWLKNVWTCFDIHKCKHGTSKQKSKQYLLEVFYNDEIQNYGEIIIQGCSCVFVPFVVRKV